MPDTCSHPFCKSGYKRQIGGKNLKLITPTRFRFPFPEDPRYKIWLAYIGHENRNLEILNKKLRLCELHFETKYIITTPMRKTLKANAIPTVDFPRLIIRF